MYCFCKQNYFKVDFFFTCWKRKYLLLVQTIFSLITDFSIFSIKPQAVYLPSCVQLATVYRNPKYNSSSVDYHRNNHFMYFKIT